MLKAFPEPLKGLIKRAAKPHEPQIEEIRLRFGRPVTIQLRDRDMVLTGDGSLSDRFDDGLIPGEDLWSKVIQLLCQGSLYAWEEELRQGFLTLPGGHRVGLAGRAVIEAGRVRTIRPVTALNFRVSREVRGAADPLLSELLAAESGRVRSCLIASPPGAGKTTVLRDLVRQISAGVVCLGWPGAKVGVIDERSEIGGSHNGVPERDLGPRTDILDGCPKAEGMMMMIRSMSPQVVAVDEIGRLDDVMPLIEALNAGVTVLATAHAANFDEVRRRPVLYELIDRGCFERVAVLSRRFGPGSVERIIDVVGGNRDAPLAQTGRSGYGTGGLLGGRTAGGPGGFATDSRIKVIPVRASGPGD